ncbi:hypothetical protein D3C80_1699840 [compost metagenome]
MRAGRPDRLHRRQRRRIGLDQIGPATQNAAALAWRTGCPVATTKRLPGVLHRFVHQRHVSDRQRRVIPAIGRARHFQPRKAVAVSATNEVGTTDLDDARVEAVHKGLQNKGLAPARCVGDQASILGNIARYMLLTLTPI